MEERLIQPRVGFSLTHLEDGEEVSWVLPGITFADDIPIRRNTFEIITLIFASQQGEGPTSSEKEVSGAAIEFLERRQRAVGRQALGCHGIVANEAVQGDLGWSSVEAREATSKISYDARLRNMDRNRWAKKLFVHTHMTGTRTRWQKRLYQLEKKYGFFAEPLEVVTGERLESNVRSRVREREVFQWFEAAQAKPTLLVYSKNKQLIAAETLLYDNSLGSRLLFEARAGALRTLVYRERFDPKVVSTMCRACREEPETVEHLVLYCECLLPAPLVDRRLHSEVMLAYALGFKTTADSDNLYTGGADDPPQDRHDISTMQCAVEAEEHELYGTPPSFSSGKNVCRMD
ncbi:hypothetical protein HPB47_006103 [Ixodes persulcatus]|uniref:Uncharacterized protein n=1 Tax=Ixodes persulcatus TaxID=34615 RepID=A0AC60PC01_IXOPE|nr:hypothetical protein HPB47_006103 [Ixodes persulcatus]